MLKITRAAFAVACFFCLSDVHESLGGLQIATYPLDKQTAGCISLHNWLVCLAMHLAALCDTVQLRCNFTLTCKQITHTLE